MLGDHMKDFYIRRGQSVKEHRIIDEGAGKASGWSGALIGAQGGCVVGEKEKHRVLSTGRPQGCWKSTGDDKRGSFWGVLCILCRPTDSLLNLA